MRGRAPTVDAAHTMTSRLQTAPHDQLEQVLATAGRFGREVRTTAWPDPELEPARSDKVVRMRARVQYYDYKIDNVVLAEAIIARVCIRQ
jgi:hypothetical protein